jgi:ADP-ribose pyrophosphatase
MSEPRGPWVIHESTVVYADPWIQVRLDRVTRPDGRAGTHTLTTIKPGVCVIALDDEGNVWLTEEFHYAVGRTTLEGVSGGCEEREPPLDTARRELEEELGFVAERWTDLGWCDPFTAMIVSPTAMYLAEELSRVPARPEGTERIVARSLPFAEVVRLVDESVITHGPTCVAILKAWMRRGLV